jgi:hypothetical protein
MQWDVAIHIMWKTQWMNERMNDGIVTFGKVWDLSLISMLDVTHYDYTLSILLSIQNMHDLHNDVLHLSVT